MKCRHEWLARDVRVADGVRGGIKVTVLNCRLCQRRLVQTYSAHQTPRRTDSHARHEGARQAVRDALRP